MSEEKYPVAWLPLLFAASMLLCWILSILAVLVLS